MCIRDSFYADAVLGSMRVKVKPAKLAPDVRLDVTKDVWNLSLIHISEPTRPY